MHLARIAPLRDHATGGRVCRRCYADIEQRAVSARYCGGVCRSRDNAKRRRVAARKGLQPGRYRA